MEKVEVLKQKFEFKTKLRSCTYFFKIPKLAKKPFKSLQVPVMSILNM